MNYKSKLGLVTSSVLAFSLAGCGGGGDSTPANIEPITITASVKYPVPNA